MALRICLLTETYHPVVGGGETQARALAEGMVKRGFEVIVLTRRTSPAFQRRERIGGVEVRRLSPTGSGHLKKWALLPGALTTLLRLRARYDLVLVSGFRVLGLAAVAVKRLLGKPCILKADSLGEMSGEFFRGGLAKFGLSPSSLPVRGVISLRNRALRAGDSYVAISSAVEAELVAHGVEPPRIRGIPNSVDVETFQPVEESRKALLRGRFGLPAAARVAIYTGRLVSYKGLPLLLEVWRGIAGRHDDAHLLLVGAGGLDIHNCEAELKRTVERYGLGGSVHFTGEVGEVHLYLQASDLFVFPSENEAFGISLIEAMACGLPVVTVEAGGLKGIVEHGKDGLLVATGDADELSGALERLLEDGGLAVRLGQRARETVESRYAESVVVDRYVSLVEELRRSAARSVAAER